MNVEVRLFGPFRDDAGVEATSLETDAETYGELLRTIEERYPALAGRIVDEDDGGLVGEVVVTCNGRNVRHLDGLDTPLSDGDLVRMIPSVYGGARS